jgi:hypothetical protein
MALKLLLSEAEFKELAPVSNNVQYETPAPQVIHAAQWEYVRPVLCDALFNEVLDQVVNDTLTTANAALMEYIRPALAWWAYATYLPFALVRARESGPSFQLGQTIQPATNPDLQNTRNAALSTAGSFANALQKFLHDNRADYPLYECSCCKPHSDGRTSLSSQLFNYM